MTWYNNYIGTRFKEKGRDAEGVDCWGLVCLVYKNELGIDLPHYLDRYNSTNERHVLTELIAEQKQNLWSEVKEPQEFDVLVLRTDGLPFHVGIYTKDRKFIHCEKGSNTTLAKMDSIRWKNNVMGAFRWVR